MHPIIMTLYDTFLEFLELFYRTYQRVPVGTAELAVSWSEIGLPWKTPSSQMVSKLRVFLQGLFLQTVVCLISMTFKLE